MENGSLDLDAQRATFGLSRAILRSAIVSTSRPITVPNLCLCYGSAEVYNRKCHRISDARTSYSNHRAVFCSVGPCDVFHVFVFANVFESFDSCWYVFRIFKHAVDMAGLKVPARELPQDLNTSHSTWRRSVFIMFGVVFSSSNSEVYRRVTSHGAS